MRRPFVRAALVVFIASFCTLVIELVAGRILAPWVGVSLNTWTSIIGVVLAGISLGACGSDRQFAILYTAVYTAIAGRWQLVSWQSTRI